MLYIEDFNNAFKKARLIKDLENEIIDLKVKLHGAKSVELKKKIERRIETIESMITIHSGDLYDVEKFIDECDDCFVAQMLRHRFINGETWVKVAYSTSKGYCTDEAVRKSVERYFAKKGITRRA